MKKTSIASLQERLAGWTDWDGASYHLGACLGFWPEFGAPGDATGPFDPWHGVKGVIWSSNPLGNTLATFLEGLVKIGALERRDEPDIQFRWNPKYKGPADLVSILE
jgi:hypothetical protein